MWKYLAALLVVLLSIGGLVAAQPDCPDCYASIITQNDIQTIDTVRLSTEDPFNVVKTVAVGNEGLTAGIIVTKAPVNPSADAADPMFLAAPFARIDQGMNQRISSLGSSDINLGDGAKGITWNKAIQAAWIANQGVKELEMNEETGEMEYVKEGSHVVQQTNQLIERVYDFDSREKGKVLNVDNKLAMIVDDMEAIINLQANADSSSTDTQSSEGTVNNTVDIYISGTDP
jgi:hypothetical protein